LEGARWSHTEHQLIESEAKVLYTPVPTIWMVPQEVSMCVHVHVPMCMCVRLLACMLMLKHVCFCGWVRVDVCACVSVCAGAVCLHRMHLFPPEITNCWVQCVTLELQFL
jgi:hypothetical protein